MSKVRKIAMVVNQIKPEDEDRLDVLFWLEKTVSERLSEVCRLRKSFYTSVNGTFPYKIEKVVHRRKLQF